MQHAAGIGETLPAATRYRYRDGFAMTVKELCQALASHPRPRMHWMLPDKSFVPAGYQITEVGRVQKDFIDCGGTVRSAVSCVLLKLFNSAPGHG